MSVIPDSKLGKIQFCEQRVTPWTTNAVAMGTTSAAVTAWEAQVVAARAAYEAQKAAQNAAKNATIVLNEALQPLMDSTASIIKQVRAKADLSGDGVYALASLPVPATPGPIGPLGQPSDFKVSLDVSGALKLTWKNTNPPGSNGAVYQIWRRFGNEGDFTYLGGVGAKEYTDATVPPGTPQVQYQIQAVRSTSVGPWALFLVNFGAGSNLSVVQATPAKIAA